MTAATACRNCGTEPRAGARFCDGCGAPVTRQDVRAEYKQVTVLFADVVHSMDIAAAVGPERLREVMADLVDRCAVVVQRYGGTVDKFTGDGIMAVFGAPVALEDHAFRACLAWLTAMPRLTRTLGTATVTWRKRLASKDISRGPRQCHNGGRPGNLVPPI